MIKNRAAVLCLLLGSGCELGSRAEAEGFQGVVELAETTLSFETSGKVLSLPADAGDRAELNQVLGTLNDELVRAVRQARALEVQVARSQAALVAAGARREDVSALDARVRAARATERTLEKNLARERALFERSVVPRAQLDEVEGQVERARAEREGLEAQLASLERGARREERTMANARAEAADAALTLEDERLERHVLRSPMAGRVLDVYVEPGEFVSAGMPVLTLGDTRRPYIDVFVPQGEMGGIDVGDRATLRVDSEREAFSGRVEHIARRTEFTPRFLFSERERPNLVVRVRVRLDDVKERLHAGVPGFVTIAREPAGARP